MAIVLGILALVIAILAIAMAAGSSLGRNDDRLVAEEDRVKVDGHLDELYRRLGAIEGELGMDHSVGQEEPPEPS